MPAAGASSLSRSRSTVISSDGSRVTASSERSADFGVDLDRDEPGFG